MLADCPDYCAIKVISSERSRVRLVRCRCAGPNGGQYLYGRRLEE